jgi:hypothetical protein
LVEHSEAKHLPERSQVRFLLWLFPKRALPYPAERNSSMIRAIKTHGGKLGEVSGNPADVIMFFNFWQFKLWPNWMSEAKLGTENDHMHRQVSGVIDTVKDGHSLKLHDQGDNFEQAFDFAVEKCKAIGIEVIETPAAV